MGGAIGLWVGAEWRRRWPALVGIAVLVAIAGGAATALAAGARRADTAYARFREATGEPNLTAQLDLGGAKPTERRLAAERFGAHVEALDDLAAVEGVESVAVESWWAIALDPEMDAPGVVTAFATGTFATAGEPAAARRHRRRAARRRRSGRRDDQRGGRPGVGPRGRQHAHVRHGVAAAGSSSGRATTVSSPPPTRSTGRRSRSASPPSPEPKRTSRRRSRRSTSPRASPGPTATRSPTRGVRLPPRRPSTVSTPSPPTSRRSLAPYGLDVTTTTGPGAAIVPSIEVGVSTLWIATAVAALGGLLLVARRSAGSSPPRPPTSPALAAMGLTRPQRTLGVRRGGDVGIAAGALAVPLVAWAASGLFPRGAAALAEPDPGLRWDVSDTGRRRCAHARRRVAACSCSSPPRPPGRDRHAAAGSGRLSGLLRGRPAMSLGASFATDPAGSGRRSRALAGAAAASIAVAVAAVLVVTTLDSSRRHLETSPRLFGAVSRAGVREQRHVRDGRRDRAARRLLRA